MLFGNKNTHSNTRIVGSIGPNVSAAILEMPPKRISARIFIILCASYYMLSLLDLFDLISSWFRATNMILMFQYVVSDSQLVMLPMTDACVYNPCWFENSSVSGRPNVSLQCGNDIVPCDIASALSKWCSTDLPNLEKRNKNIARIFSLKHFTIGKKLYWANKDNNVHNFNLNKLSDWHSWQSC